MFVDRTRSAFRLAFVRRASGLCALFAYVVGALVIPGLHTVDHQQGRRHSHGNHAPAPERPAALIHASAGEKARAFLRHRALHQQDAAHVHGDPPPVSDTPAPDDSHDGEGAAEHFGATVLGGHVFVLDTRVERAHACIPARPTNEPRAQSASTTACPRGPPGVRSTT